MPFKDILEGISDGLIALDNNWNYVYLNEKAAAIAGNVPANLIGKNIWQTDTEQDRAFYDACHEAMEKHEPVFLDSCYYKQLDKYFELHIYPSDVGLAIHFRDISQKKKTEEKNRRYHERFENLARVMYDGLWEWDIETDELWCNESYKKMYGVAEDDPVPTRQQWLRQLHPDDFEEKIKDLDAIFTTGITSWESEYRFKKPDGRYATIFDRCHVTRSNEGKPIRMVAVMVDITARKEAEQALRNSERRFRTIFEAEPECIKLINEKGELLDINPAGLAMLEADCMAQVQHQVAGNWLPPEYGEPLRQLIKKVFQGDNATMEYEIIGLKGAHRWAESHFVPLRDAAGNIEAMLSVTRDITGRKKIESQLIKERELADKLIDSLPGVFYFFDDTGKMLRWNKRAETVTGRTAEEMATMNPIDFFEGRSINIVHDKIQRAFENGEAEAEAELLTKSGQALPYYFKDRRIEYNGRPCIVGTAIDISELRKAEAQIIREKELTDRMIDSLPGIFYLFDDTGKFIRWNKQLETISGYTAQEIADMHPARFFEGEEQQYIIQKIQEVFDGGETFAEAHVVTKGGEKIPFYFKGIRMIYEGRPCLIGKGIDISERKAAEAQVIKERDLSDKFINTMPGLVYLFNEKRQMLRWNKEFETVSGYTPDEIAAMKPTDFFRGDGITYIDRKINEAFKNGQAEAETNFTTKSERQIPFYFRGARIIYDDEPCIVGCGINITERMQFETQIIKEKDLSDKLINNLPATFYLFDQTGKLLRWNQQLETVTGYSHQEIEQMNPAQFFPEGSYGLIAETIGRAFAQGEVLLETETLTKEGQLIPYIFKAARILYNDVPCIIGTGTDITSIKRAEAMLKELNLKLEQRALELERSNSELEQFAYVASHDLQEPLRMVSSFLQLFERKYKGMIDETADKYIHFSVNGAEQMKRLIQDLLQYSRVGRSNDEITDTDMNKVAEEVIQTFQTEITERNATVQAGPLPVLPRTRRLQMVQLLQNLVSNGLKYNKSSHPAIEIKADKTEDEWILTVKDNGLGFPQKYAEKVFMLFQRLHNRDEYSGTGIGLSICKKIMELHGGRIWVESIPGAGSTFYLTFPKNKPLFKNERL